MKKWLVLLASLALASCIEVADPGIYWDKGVVDMELAGKWAPLSDQGEISEIHIVSKGNEMGVEEYSDGEKITDDGENEQSPIRTLHAGPYRFVMEKEDKDISVVMFRYEIRNNSLVLYRDNPEAIEAFLKKSFPENKDIVVKNYGEGLNGKYTHITYFTDDVFRILSQIPNNETYWKESSKYERIP